MENKEKKIKSAMEIIYKARIRRQKEKRSTVYIRVNEG